MQRAERGVGHRAQRRRTLLTDTDRGHSGSRGAVDGGGFKVQREGRGCMWERRQSSGAESDTRRQRQRRRRRRRGLEVRRRSKLSCALMVEPAVSSRSRRRSQQPGGKRCRLNKHQSNLYQWERARDPACHSPLDARHSTPLPLLLLPAAVTAHILQPQYIATVTTTTTTTTTTTATTITTSTVPNPLAASPRRRHPQTQRFSAHAWPETLGR